MTELSPKAQAVLDAAYSELDPYSELDSYVTQRGVGWCAAAALRALVDACSFEDFNTRLISASDVIAIAEELDTL